MQFIIFVLGSVLAAPREEYLVDPAALSVELEQQAEAAADQGLDVHGFGVLSLRGGDASMDSGINVLLAQLELRYAALNWGLYAVPRLRVIGLASGHDQGAAFMQQIYAYVRHPWGDLKVGKVYRRFGRLWDYGMYGPLAAQHDITMQPDYGIAAEGAPELDDHWALDYAAQYFAVDGRSLSLQHRPYLSGGSIRRRHIVVGHLAPNYSWSSTAHGAVGLSGESFEVHADADWQRVSRLALDVDGSMGPLSGFFELGQQWGTDRLADFSDAPSPGNLFAWSGVHYARPSFNLRYNLGVMRFWEPPYAVEILHQPGVEWLAHPNLSVVFEAAVFTTSDFSVGTLDGYRERSAYLVAMGKF
jgi:hypothetical protein